MAKGYRPRFNRRQMLGVAAGASAALWLARGAPARAADGPGGIIALPRARDVALVAPDGSSDRTVVSLQPGEFVADVALSPDGRRLAYGMFRAQPGDTSGGSDIVVASVEPGSEPTVVAPRDRPGTLLAAPHWSPDGSALVFESVGLSASGQASVTAEWIGLDGSGRRTVAQAARYPSFAPDGGSIVYTKALPTGDALWTQPLDGSPGREIVPESAFLLITYARYSPDGRWIAFTAVSNSPTPLPPPGSPFVPSAPGTPGAPKLIRGLPGGRGEVRGVAAHGFPAEPYVVPAAGGEPRLLAPLPIDDAALAWSPDGTLVAVSGANGLFLVGMAGGEVRRVAENGSFGAIDWR